MSIFSRLVNLPQRLFYTLIASAYLAVAIITVAFGYRSGYYLSYAALLAALALYGFWCAARRRHFNILMLPATFAVISVLIFSFHKSTINAIIFAVAAASSAFSYYDIHRRARRPR